MKKLLDQQAKVQEQIDAATSWNLDSKIEIAMDALRLPPADADVTKLSGGEKRRVALCRTLLEEPDMLLLDEPTNHLDAESVAWLERYLAEFPGTVVAVTHDRYFLDNVAEWILELDRGAGIPYEGNYTSWLDQKRTRLATEEKQASARQRTLERELEWVRMSPRARQAKSKARIQKYEELATAAEGEKVMQNEIVIPPPARLGNDVVIAKGLKKAYGDKVLFDDLSFSLPRGGIVGVIGPNGAGKTTLFRMIVGKEKADGGALKIGDTVQLAYVDQTRELNDTNTVYKEVSEGNDVIQVGKREMQTRAYLAQLQLQGCGPAEEGGGSLRWRAEPAAPRQAPQIRREPAAARRADERSRRRYAASARGSAGRFSGMRRRDLARSVVSRSYRDAHPRVRGELRDRVVRGVLS